MYSSSLSFDSDIEYPDSFYCPIAKTVMYDPVIAADGFTYSRSSISDWFRVK